jgi:tetratricopeptide (TPR) repeat protein
VNGHSANSVAEAVADGWSPPAHVDSRDLLRFQRLFDRTLGLGFRLVVWESSTDRDRTALRAWLQPMLAARSVRLIEVDLVELLGRTDSHAPRSINVWSELTRAVPPATVADHRSVLMLSGFEELMYHGADGRSDLLQQFNVQRDILARDYPCWWLLLVHPASRQHWQTVAPDFSDFVSLWIEAPLPKFEGGMDRLTTVDEPQRSPGPDRVETFADWPEELRAAYAALRASRLDLALDQIHSFRAATTSRPRTERELAIAELLEGEILNVRGNSAAALRLWRDRVLPVFTRLGMAYEQGLAMDRIGDALAVRENLTEAGRLYRESLAIRERLVQMEPDCADFQRDLSVSYGRMGDLYRALGQGEPAREAYLKSLTIIERLAQAEPDRADYQRDLSVAYERMGDLYRALGQGEPAREAYLKSLAIRERLAQAEPDRADYQRGLSVSHARMGDLYSDLGQGEPAREAYLKSLAIAERLAQAEPDRADYQDDLSVSYGRMGDVYSALGRGEPAREAYLKSLAIIERLAQAEPDRADYQRDLAVSYNKVGDVYRALGQGEPAREAYLKTLAIFERLAQAEPDRADYQRDLVVSLWRLGEADDAEGEVSSAAGA